MTYLYAGLGMAMLTAIMAMFEMATGITNQQMFGLSKNDAYIEAGVGGIDQALLDLAVKELQGWAKPDPASLCGRVIELIDDNPDDKYSLLDLRPPESSYKNAFVESDPLLVPPRVKGCQASAPIEGNSSLRHRVVIAPVMMMQDGDFLPVRPYRYTVWSCVTSSLCNYEESL